MALKQLLLFIFIVFLSSCSSSKSINENFNNIKTLKDYSIEKPIKVFSRKDIENIEYPLIEIKTNGILRQALMLPISQRGNFVNYTSGSGQIITMNGAVITKTNGFNINLISVEINKNSPLLFLKRPENWQEKGYRTYSYVNSINQIYSETYECKLILKEKQEVFIVGTRYKLTNIEEQCIKEDKSFVNLYWVDDNGFVWQSNQRLKNKIFAFLTIIKPLKKP